MLSYDSEAPLAAIDLWATAMIDADRSCVLLDVDSRSFFSSFLGWECTSHATCDAPYEYRMDCSKKPEP